MNSGRSSQTLRLFIGGIAAALGVGAVTTQVVQVSAEPTSTTDDTGRVDVASLPAPGTYQSCTAKFGLHKYNSDLAQFDIVQGANPVTPLPVLGTNIVPIVTVSDGTTTVECEAVPGWTDETSFTNDYISPNTYAVGSTMTYPGTGYYLLPAMNGITLLIDGVTPIVATSRTITFPNDLTAGTTLSPATANPTALQAPHMPYYTIDPAAVTDSFFTRVYAAVTSAPTGNAGQAAYLHNLLDEYANSQSSTCSDSDPVLQGLVVTLASLQGDAVFTATDCYNVIAAAIMVGAILDYDAQVNEPAITLSVSGPAPSTTTTTVAPVTPTFTG